MRFELYCEIIIIRVHITWQAALRVRSNCIYVTRGYHHQAIDIHRYYAGTHVHNMCTLGLYFGKGVDIILKRL